MSKTIRKNTCCVKGCASVNDNIREALFVFPPLETPRGKRWLEIFPNSFSLKQNVDNYICGRHFTPECFNSKGGLLHRADPTVNIDTSYAQDPIMKTFLMKVLYEWSLRTNADINSCGIMKKAMEARPYLGMRNFQASASWYSKFLQFRIANQVNGTRFGSGQAGSKNLIDIIKDIRNQLPSNLKLPADSIPKEPNLEEEKEEEAIEVKNEICSDDDDDEPLIAIKSRHRSRIENEESADEPFQTKDFVPQTSLDTYQEALELLQPLREFIKRTGNENAIARLREVETVVKQVIKNEAKAKKPTKKKR